MKKPFLLLFFVMFWAVLLHSQTMESITFSAAASNNDNFQPVVGAPFGASLSGSSGSLEISASYGESTYEESTLSVEKFDMQSAIRVYPNPTTTSVNIDLSQLQAGEYGLFLVDLNGRVISEKHTHQTTEEIDVSHLPVGVYLLQVYGYSAKKLETFKIVKK